MKFYSLNIFLYLFFLKFTFSIKPINPDPAQNINESCKTHCRSEYGIEIGIFNGVISYSNCNDNCINDSEIEWTAEMTGLARKVYVGVRWQCVEYARRFLIINKNVSFDSIDYAYQIFNLTIVQDLNTIDMTKEFRSFPNGNISPPEVGDLIIYPKKKENPFGHVAVVSEVDLNEGFIGLAEQNFFNKKWQNQSSYSRRVKIFKCKDRYVLTEKIWNIVNFNSIFSFENCCDKTDDVIGWKRVIS